MSEPHEDTIEHEAEEPTPDLEEVDHGPEVEPSPAFTLAERIARYIKVPALILVGVLIGALLFSGGKGGSDAAHGAHDHAAKASSEQTWTCSMHPQVQSPEPGDCPICGMDLVDASTLGETSADASAGEVFLTPRAKKLARIVTSEVEVVMEDGADRKLLGIAARDEDRHSVITSWIGGRIERLYVKTTGERVRKGQVLASVYSPEVYAAHRELMSAKAQLERLSGATEIARMAATAQLESARQKLRLLGIDARSLAQMEGEDVARTRIKIRATSSGTVLARNVSQGDYIKVGESLFELTDLSKIWVLLDAYESDLAHVSLGQRVSLTFEAYPERVFEGKVAFIDPLLDPKTRTTSLRVEVENEDRVLKPGMYARATLEGKIIEPGSALPLVIPRTAPLFAGRRSLVYVEKQSDAEGALYQAREVKLGERMGDGYQVLAGLKRGDRVVTHGAFVLDSDLQIRGGTSLLTRPDDTESSPSDDILDLDPSITRQLAPVVEGYLDVQEKLANDEFDAAITRARAWREDVKEVSLDGAPPNASSAWEKISRKITMDLDQLIQASEIGRAREVFEHLTRDLEEVMLRFGNPSDEPIRVAYCPMAFDNRGGHWFQRGEQVDNVYYGNQMRRCGEVQRAISPGEHVIPTGGK